MSNAKSDAEGGPNSYSWNFRKISKDASPQQIIDKFWKKFTTKYPGKPFTVLPNNLYAERIATQNSRKIVPSKNAVASYEQAAAACKAKVEKIAQDCRRLNQKYKDPHFDIEFDFMQWQRYERTEDCLAALDEDEASLRPMSVKRVEDIFDEPHFYIEGMTANDVRQGRDGDCWLMSSVCTLSNKEDLLEKVCIARDEKVGVYGFVFYRDGEWISEVIDDKLYLTKEDFHESFGERYDWLTIDMPNPDDEYRNVMQTGSKALYFAQCRDQNETWLPLLEKAYAKAHGDYSAIEGGWVGEGLEDLTGGVTSELFAADILDKDKFWADELMNVNKLFLFGLAQMGGKFGERRGIIEQHAYSIMEVRELDNFRLLKIRNPWGKKEWDGPWSDGSEEWTPDRMRRLNHQFGNDGVFWISYKDLLKHFQHIDRTRLFGSDWSIAQQWTSVNVPWSVNYLDTHFRIHLSKAGPVVILLSQLDDRYFRGLEGQYYFQLQYRLHKDGEADYIARSKPSYFMYRSVTTELDLEAGHYSVMVKITADRYKSRKTPEEIVQQTCQTRPEKLMAVGLSYDLAHAKGRLKEREVELKERQRSERRLKRKADAKKAFEAQRLARKKEKLRRLRVEAKEKAKKGSEPEKNNGPPDGIEISVRMGEKACTPSKPESANERKAGSKTVSSEGTSKQWKVIVETSDKLADGEGQQPAKDRNMETEDAKQAQEGTKSDSKGEYKSVEDTNLKDGPDKRKESISSSLGMTPTTSAESSVTEGSNKTERQPSEKLADKSAADDQNTSTTVTTKAEETIKQSNQAEAGATLQNLALDNISDDDLSWSSDIDVPLDSPSESDSYSDIDIEAPAPPKPGPPKSANDKPSDDPAQDPWNAVCVFGLRVYSKNSQAEIEVVTKVDEGEAVESEKLDVDDQAADAAKKGKTGDEGDLENQKADKIPVGEEESKQG